MTIFLARKNLNSQEKFVNACDSHPPTAKRQNNKVMTKYTYFRIDFEDWSGDYDYTIVPTIEDVQDYLKSAEMDLDDSERKTKVIITGVAMTRKEFNKWFKENVTP